jgi:hypothetical protein
VVGSAGTTLVGARRKKMRGTKWITLAFLAIASAACGPRRGTQEVGSPAPDGGTTAAATGETSHGWPVMPGLDHECNESVLSQDGSEVLWDGFVTDQAPDVVAAWYKEQLGTETLDESGGDWTWRSTDPAAPRVLSVYAVGGPGVFCPEMPPEAVTFVNASEMNRPN